MGRSKQSSQSGRSATITDVPLMPYEVGGSGEVTRAGTENVPTMPYEDNRATEQENDALLARLAEALTGSDADAEASDASDAPESEDADDIESEAADDDAESDDAERLYKVTVNGEDIEVTLDELRAGYTRDRDYTQKTQKVAEIRRAAQQEREAHRQAVESYAQ